jgi:hypothetical protein
MYIQKFGGLGSRQGRIGRVYSSRGEEPFIDDVNEEYWVKVRNLPALVGTISGTCAR